MGRLFFQHLFHCKKYFKYMKDFWLTSGGRKGKILLLVVLSNGETFYCKQLQFFKYLFLVFSCMTFKVMFTSFEKKKVCFCDKSFGIGEVES